MVFHRASLADFQPFLKENFMSDDDDDNPILGWIIFILIFGVGNLILYATTGIFFIPIPRR